MDKEQSYIKQMYEDEGRQKIRRLEQRINTTKHNLEVSSEIIANSESDAQRDKSIEKNKQREHAIGSMNKEIRDIEETLQESNREVPT